MNLLLLVGIGGFIGAILRYSASGFIQNGMASFPLGTLGVNVIGSFFLGFVMYASEYQGIFSEETRVFLTLGILGAFTTMSTFSYESFKLLENNEFILLSINIIGTLMLTIGAIYLGRLVVLALWS